MGYRLNVLAAGVVAGVVMVGPGNGLLADVEVNPDGNGFTDVRHGVGLTLLTNPLASTVDVRPDDLFVGNTGDGELRLFKPGLTIGVVHNADGFVGHSFGSEGKVTVEQGSIWSNENLTVGLGGTGTVDVLTGGLVAHSGEVALGAVFGTTGTMTIDGAGSKLNTNVSNDMRVGQSGTGFMHVSDGGVVSNEDGAGYVGDTATGVGTVTVDGAGSLIDIGFLFVGNFGQGSLDISGGGVVTNGAAGVAGSDSGSVGDVTVDGAGSRWEAGQVFVGRNGGTGTLEITNGGVVETLFSGEVRIGNQVDAMGTVTVDGVGSELISGGMEVGRQGGSGSLGVSGGGEVTASGVAIGDTAFGLMGEVTVDGAGSKLTSNGLMRVGNQGGRGVLDITNGAVVDVVGGVSVAEFGLNSRGEITVDGAGSRLNVSGELRLSLFGTNTDATLDVRNGGFVSVNNMFLTLDEVNDRVGRVIVQSGGELLIESDATIQGDLTLADGTVTFSGDRVYDPVGESLRGNVNGVLVPRSGVLGLGERLKVEGEFSVLSPIVIDGGGLSAGSIPNVVAVDFVRGELELTAVDVDVTDAGLFGDEISLNADQHLKVSQAVNVLGDGRVDLDGGRLGAGMFVNDGVVEGDGQVDGPLANHGGGEVRVNPGESLLFTGLGNENDGEINLLGGASVLGATVEFEQGLGNSPGGRIAGRGTLIVAGGLANAGEMAFSGGFSDVHGDVTMTGGVGTVISTSGGVLTFFDDVDHNGEFIRTSAGSVTTFLGDVTGSGPYTGTGTVNFEAGFSPGSSPGEVEFAGDVALGGLSVLTLELGGVVRGEEYDYVNVAGALRAGGVLKVVLIDGFRPSLGDEFEVLGFGGVSGGFEEVVLPGLGHGLSFEASGLLVDGGLVVVPEPGSAGLLLALTAGMTLPYRRRS